MKIEYTFEPQGNKPDHIVVIFLRPDKYYVGQGDTFSEAVRKAQISVEKDIEALSLAVNVLTKAPFNTAYYAGKE